jgi:hypothetical protein
MTKQKGSNPAILHISEAQITLQEIMSRPDRASIQVANNVHDIQQRQQSPVNATKQRRQRFCVNEIPTKQMNKHFKAKDERL